VLDDMPLLTRTFKPRSAFRCPWCRQGDDRVLVIGADTAGRLLEVVVLDPDGEPVAIHPMPLRQKFNRYL